MPDMTVDTWRELVGVHVEKRRRSMFPSRRKAADGSGRSEIVWRQIESGKRQLTPDVIVPPNPDEETKVCIARRLEWEDDAIDRLVRGEAPIETVHPRRSRLRALRFIPGFKTGEQIGRMQAIAENEPQRTELIAESFHAIADWIEDLDQRVKALEAESGDKHLAEAAAGEATEGAREAPVQMRPHPEAPEA